MSDRKENIKRSLGITEYPWSSDDDDVDMEAPRFDVKLEPPLKQPNEESELSNDTNGEDPIAEDSNSSICDEEQQPPSRIDYQQLWADVQNGNRQYFQRSSANPSNDDMGKRLRAVELKRIVPYKKLKRHDGTTYRYAYVRSASNTPIELRANVIKVRRTNPDRMTLRMLRGESIIPVVRGTLRGPQPSTSRDIGVPPPSHQPSTCPYHSLPATGSLSGSQTVPTANSLQSPVADSAPAIQSRLATNPLSHDHSLPTAPEVPTIQLPTTGEACPTTYEFASSQVPTTTQEPAATHTPADADVLIATDASATTEASSVPFAAAMHESSSADAPFATLASPSTTTAPLEPRPLFGNARSIYNFLAPQTSYKSNPPSTSSPLHSSHEPSTSYASSIMHVLCPLHTPSTSSAPPAIHTPSTTIPPTTYRALPAVSSDSAPPTVNSEEPNTGMGPLLPGIQQSTQSHDLTDGETGNVDVGMHVDQVEVPMSNTDGGCRPHEPHDFITLEPGDMAIASTSQPESRSQKSNRDGGVTDGEPYTVKEFNQCLLRLFECPVCLEWMEPPIAQCRRGHLVCSRCIGRLSSCPVCRTALSSVRNRAMEGVAELLRYPCRHGCGREVRLRRRCAHEANCIARRYRCPAPNCGERAHLQLPDLLTHLLKKHKSLVKSGTTHKFSMKMNTKHNETWLVIVGRELFHLHIDVDVRSWGIVVYVIYIGPKCKANNYTYQVTVDGQNSERKLVYSRVTHSDLESSSQNLNRQDCFHLPVAQALNFLRMKNKHCEPDKFLDFILEINNRDITKTPSERTLE